MEADEQIAPIPERKKPKRKLFRDHLPMHEMLHEPEADGACICPACGGGMGKLGEDVHRGTRLCAGTLPHYGPARTKPGPITEVACWAHTRRGFFDEWEHHKSPTAKQALERIVAIYALKARAAFAPPAKRVELRRQTLPLLDEFFTWADATTAKLSAKFSLAGAVLYAINRRNALSRFLTDGRLEVDANIADNATRGIAIGRANYLFAGSDAGGDRSGAVYTLVQTSKLKGVNPESYLRDILAKLPTAIPSQNRHPVTMARKIFRQSYDNPERSPFNLRQREKDAEALHNISLPKRSFQLYRPGGFSLAANSDVTPSAVRPQHRPSSCNSINGGVEQLN